MVVKKEKWRFFHAVHIDLCFCSADDIPLSRPKKRKPKGKTPLGKVPPVFVILSDTYTVAKLLTNMFFSVLYTVLE